MNCSSRSQDIPPWKVIELPATPDVRHEINLLLSKSYSDYVNGLLSLSDEELAEINCTFFGSYLLIRDAINQFLIDVISHIELKERGVSLRHNWNKRETMESYFRFMNSEGNHDWKNISPELRSRKMAIELIINDWYTYLQGIKDPTMKQIVGSHQCQLLNLMFDGCKETDWLHILDHNTRTAYKVQAFHAKAGAFRKPLEG